MAQITERRSSLCPQISAVRELYTSMENVILFFVSGISYNRPKLCSSATWREDPEVFANASVMGNSVYSVFLDRKDDLYAIATELAQIFVWPTKNTTLKCNLTLLHRGSMNLFVNINGHIFVDYNSTDQYGVMKWIPGSTSSELVLTASERCYFIFLDVHDNIFCSMTQKHMILRRSFNDHPNVTKVYAGNGTAGNTSELLNRPHGIFITKDQTLYIADCGNNRVQLIRDNMQISTVADNFTVGAYALNCPIGITVDSDENVYVTDSNNNRILMLNSKGVRCIIGCMATKLNLLNPWSLGFDTIGNLFVAEAGNARILAFNLSTNCGS